MCGPVFCFGQSDWGLRDDVTEPWPFRGVRWLDNIDGPFPIFPQRGGMTNQHSWIPDCPLILVSFLILCGG